MSKKLIIRERVSSTSGHAEHRLIERREAIVRLVAGAGAFVAATSGLGAILSGCGAAAEQADTLAEETSDAVACTTGTTVSVGTDKASSHTHKIDLTIAQVEAQADIQITLLSESRGGTDLAHTHWVTVTAADLTKLVNGEVVTIMQPAENTSGDDEHDHIFDVYCA
jgi:hypothetical protein